MSTASLLMEMLRIPSVSGNEAALGEYLAKRLSGNFIVTKQAVGS